MFPISFFSRNDPATPGQTHRSGRDADDEVFR